MKADPPKQTIRQFNLRKIQIKKGNSISASRLFLFINYSFSVLTKRVKLGFSGFGFSGFGFSGTTITGGFGFGGGLSSPFCADAANDVTNIIANVNNNFFITKFFLFAKFRAESQRS